MLVHCLPGLECGFERQNIRLLCGISICYSTMEFVEPIRGLVRSSMQLLGEFCGLLEK